MKQAKLIVEILLTISPRAKYIEGLENRLGRMESLLKMSGLLTDEEAGKTDLGTLEKRLAEKVTSNGSPLLPERTHVSATSSTLHPSESNGSTPQHDNQQSPRTATTSPGIDAEKEKKAEVENLSDMMCSLVTNNCGETRYIGVQFHFLRLRVLMMSQARRQVSRSSHQKASNGSTRRRATSLSNK